MTYNDPNYLHNQQTFDILQKNNRFPDLHQAKPVSKYERNLVQSTRNMKTQYVL